MRLINKFIELMIINYFIENYVFMKLVNYIKLD